MVLLKLGSKKNSAEAVPEHLPALPNHEVKEKVEEKKIPDALPPIEKKSVPDVKPQVKEDTTQEKSVPDVKPQAKEEPKQEPKEETKQEQIIQENKKTIQNTTPNKLSSQFFTRLQAVIDKEEPFDKKKNKLLEFSQEDLFNKLEDFYDSSLNKEDFIIHKDELNILINQKLEKLKSLETTWHADKEKLKQITEKVKTQEHELKKEIDNLKKLMTEASEDEVDRNNFFHLYKGGVIKNLRQLKQEITDMNDEVFNHHVNQHRNDFSEWIRHVFKKEDLANKLKHSKTKEEFLNNLQI